MYNFRNRFCAALAIFAALAMPVHAQTVIQVPIYLDNGVPVPIYDFGNGPLEVRVLQGNASIFSMQGSGVSTAVAASTTMVLQATAAATPPCVGCVISGAGITAGTTVAAFNGTTTITLSAAMTVANGTPVSWGMSCPTSLTTQRVMQLQPGQPAGAPDTPLYTYARLCGAAPNGPGAAVLTFPIAAH
jgi:hypothetical protein